MILIRKLVKACLLTGLFATILGCGTLAFCCVMACTRPGFYATALAQPMNEVEVASALSELEMMVRSLDLFLHPSKVSLQRKHALPTKADPPAWNATADTFAVSVTERHLNAWLKMQAGADIGDLRNPHISLQDDTIRFAATVLTPAAELVLSCELVVTKTHQSDLTFELRSAHVGRLPLPVATALQQYMRTNPVLPKDYRLNVDGDRPTLTVRAIQEDAKLQLDELTISDGKVHCKFRRKSDSVLAVK